MFAHHMIAVVSLFFICLFALPAGAAEPTVTLPRLVDLGAGKCIPCKKMAPILKELTEEYKGRVVIKIIEVYQEREMTQANRIRLIPTQIFFDSKNQEVFRHEGFMDKEEIKKVFDKMGVK